MTNTVNRIALGITWPWSLRVWLIAVAIGIAPLGLADDSAQRAPVEVDPLVRSRCLDVLREGLAGRDFWPAMHAAEGLSIGGYGEELQPWLKERLESETDDQRRCGLARELVRAGDHSAAEVMLSVLAGDDTYGHVHAAESLYKVWEIGDGEELRDAMQREGYPRLNIMAAAALARAGSPAALPVLREQLLSDDRELSRTAAWVLARVGNDEDIVPIRQQLESNEDALTVAYYEHALAALGDQAGRVKLVANLSHPEPAVRTYAAEFVPDAWAIEAAPRLVEMLEDPHQDARIRAAHALFALAQPPPESPAEDVSVLVYEATEEHPRFTEGSVIRLNDGRLLYATTEFGETGSDFSAARIVARESPDRGRTWGAQRVLQENTGQQNVMSVTLRWMDREDAAAPRMAMFYLQKNAPDDLQMFVRMSGDEGLTFGDATRVTMDAGYHVVNNDRITRLSTGRWIVPASSTPNVETDGHFICHCYYSDDGCRNWTEGKGRVDLPRRGAMEPEVVELNDGRLLMIIRTQLGYIAASYSDDRGDTWSKATSLGVTAPEAPATIRRVPATGDLLLVWNKTHRPGAGHGGPRTPLTAAVSSDEGRTWRHVKDLEANPDRTFAYTSVLFDRGRVVLTYWESGLMPGQLSSRFRSLPVSRLYADETP